MIDLDFILGLGTGCGAGLIEMGRVPGRRGTGRRIFLAPNGRIGAAVGGGRAALARHLGYVGDGRIELSRSELKALDAACRDWARRRDGWAAFWESCAGYPGGYGSAWCFQAPGPESPRVKVGSWCYGRKTGEPFRGKDVVVPRPRPLRGVGGIPIVATIRHVGERFGRSEGEEVGVVYRLSPAARLEARRHDAVLVRAGRRMGLEPGDDEDFIRGLLKAMGGKR